MKNIKLLFLLILLSLGVNAQNGNFTSSYQMSIGTSFSVLDDVKESELVGYEAMLGYRFQESILFEAGFGNYGLSESKQYEFKPVLVRFKSMIPVSDYASLYLGGGAAYDDKSYPLLTAGVNYRIDDNWYVDAGYQGIFDIEAVDTNLYSFNVSLVYRFTNKEEVTPALEVIPIVKDTPTIPVVAEDKKTIVPVEKIVACVKKSADYKVKEGDYIISIARQHNMTLPHFLKVNKQFNSRNINLIYPGEIISYSYIDCEL